MGRKSNAQKLEETTERLTDAIKYNKEDLQKDINEDSFKIGFLLYKEASLVQDINKKVSLLDLYKRRLEALQTVEPTEESFGKWFDDFYINHEKKEINDTNSIINLEIVLSFLYSYIEAKYGFPESLNKMYQIKAIIGIK